MALFYAPLLGMTAPYGTAAFQNGRYLGAPVGAAMILAACGAAWLLRQTLGHRPPEMQTAPRRPRSAGTPAPQRWRQASRVLYVLVGALVLFNAVSAGLATARNTASAESSVNRMQVAVGKWLELETPANAVIACNDVGAIGYFANRRVLDLLGLVTPDVVPYLERQPVGREDLGDLEYIRDRRPDYLAIFPDWFPHLKTARARFLKPVLLVDVPDNTASRWAFTPALHSFAGVLVLGLDVVPKPATMVVFEYDWTKDSGRSTPLSP